jgi:opine dehydrogenase
MSSIAIIGAGNGGQAFAGYLAIQGHEVRIFDVVQDTIDQLNEKGGITIEGKSDVTGFGKLALASTDMGAVLRGAEIVLVILPSIYTASIAEKMSPYLEDGQYVMINPNACLGVVEFRHVLNQCGCKAKITLACSATLLFACRAKEPGHVVISGQKISFSAAALPATTRRLPPYSTSSSPSGTLATM